MTVILIVAVLVLMFGTAPMYPYSRTWGYGPSGLMALVLIVLLFLLASGRL